MGNCGERKEFRLGTAPVLSAKRVILVVVCVVMCALCACPVAMGQVQGMTYYPQQDGVDHNMGNFPLRKGLSYTAVFGTYLWVVGDVNRGVVIGYAWASDSQVTTLAQFRERIGTLRAELEPPATGSAASTSPGADAAARRALYGALQRVQVLLNENRVGPAAFWFDVVKRGKDVLDACNRALAQYAEVLSDDQKRELSIVRQRVAEIAGEVQGRNDLAMDVVVRDAIWYQQQAVYKITGAAASTLETLEQQRQLAKERTDIIVRLGAAGGVVVAALCIAVVAALRHRRRTAKKGTDG